MQFEHNHEHPSAEDECPMKMLFHFTDCEKILFNGWNTNALWKFIISCIGIFLMAFLYEAFKFAREQLQLQQFKREAGQCAPGCDPPQKTFKEGALNTPHIIQTFLYLIQMTFSYTLMLIVMTFNWWLFFAVLFGAMLGYFVFGWIRQKQIDAETCCK
uniref:Copper transport protein n=1 Tax=Culicoides sonorensis TaxID=179676 RepID=A0A336L827_CULSO